ncbi:MAG TPA: SAM-dependent methyltransferase [Candidatus Saccharimonadia bacterium]|nr:SAM-dependent methyltransferase [Candidatus Saccharimonadia bacterium]
MADSVNVSVNTSANSSESAPVFVFATCKAGWEKQVKEDAKAAPQGLRPAFMRPGLITWKCERAPGLDFVLPSIFARVTGFSVGSCKDAAALLEKLGALKVEPLKLHVYPREFPEDGFPMEEWSRMDLFRSRLIQSLREAGLTVSDDTTARSGDTVLDIILDDDPDAPFFAGWHRHGEKSHATPGGIPRAVIPSQAPSRAWLKLVQALSFAGLDADGALEGRTALELGSAPGGASYALLQRGVRTFGVDPGSMDDRVLRFTGPRDASFTHLRMPVGDVLPGMLPPKADILISDLNLAPAIVIRLARKMQELVHADLLILTLKINDRAVLAGLQECLAAIRDYAPGPVRATQLPGNRDEICVVAGKLG